MINYILFILYDNNKKLLRRNIFNINYIIKIRYNS